MKMMNIRGLSDYTRSWAGLLFTAFLLSAAGCFEDGATGPAGPAGATGPAGPPGVACWDLNSNGIGDPEEDTNGDGVVDVLDCQASAPPPGGVSTVAGHVLQAAHGSRAGLKAIGSFDSTTGAWTVILSRTQTSDTPTQDVQFDLSNAANLYGFSAAIFDNAGGNPTTMAPQDPLAYTLGNENSTADLKAQPVTSEPTGAADFSGPVLTTNPIDPANAAPVALQAAYDSKNVYILGVWTDLSGDQSLAKDQWEFDGSSWSRPGGRNEDRIALMFDINTTDWGTGGAGCALYCHVAEQPGAGGRMRTNNAGETLDMWHWKAARSNPLGFADDKHVIWADGFNDSTTKTRKGDDGSSVDSNNKNGAGTLPAFMAESDPGANATFLINLPQGSARAVPFDPNASHQAGDNIAGHVLQAAHGSRAGLKAIGSFDSTTGAWTVILSRTQTSDTPTQDVQFDLSNAANLYGFSAAIFDNAGGNPTTMAPQDPLAYTLGNENSTADLKAQPVTSEPTGAADFSGPVLTTNPIDPANAAPVALQAAYDSKNVYILGVWTDLSGDQSLAKDQWEFDGSSWSRPGGRNEDRIALMFDINTTDWGTGGAGCALYCHVAEQPGAGGRMRTNNAGETLDMWHWKAARSNPLGFADDKHVIWADGFNDSTTKTRKGDDGSSVDSNNKNGAGTLPAFMAESDPGANATFLVILPDGSARAVPFDPNAFP